MLKDGKKSTTNYFKIKYHLISSMSVLLNVLDLKYI